MKIGILTFHFAINYGAVLQCLGLQKSLQEMGHEVEIIDFRPPNFMYSPFWKGNKYRVSFQQGLIKAFVKLLFARRQIKKFNCFRERYLNISETYTLKGLENITNEYDAIVVGSDQIWNSSQHHHGAYFLAPLKQFRGRRISYAACCGKNLVKKNDSQLLISNLKRFHSISVRNIETEKFVLSLLNEKSTKVLDPTLITEIEFDEVSKKYPQNYILAYILGSEIQGGHEPIINKIKNEIGDYPVLAIILSENKPHYFSWANKSFYSLSPIDWVYLFKNAKHIYTDSFHGVLFALKYKKTFLAYYSEKNRSARFQDLAKRFQLEKYIVTSVTEAMNKKSFEPISNYSDIDILLEIEKNKSVEFLKSALNQ